MGQYRDLDKRRANNRASYQRNKDRYNQKQRERYANDPEYRERKRTQSETIRVQKKYGMTLEEYDAMRALPCSICGEEGPSHIDHCHKSNKVRGPLCGSCNRGIGLLQHSPARLAAAMDYLLGWKA